MKTFLKNLKRMVMGLVLLIVTAGCAFMANKTFDYSEQTGILRYDHGIAIYGDSRKDHTVHRRIVENILAFEPVSVFHLGDAVSEGDDRSQWRDFDLITKTLRATVPLYPVIGNHEKGVDPEWYLNRWEVPIGEGYYSLNLLKTGELVQLPVSDTQELQPLEDVAAHFVVLHSNKTFLDKDGEQYRWLISELEQYREIPTILLFHIPLYSAGVHFDDMNEQHPSKVLYELLDSDEYNIAACINGHDHAYERFTVDGVRHIVTGCAGEKPYEVSVPDHPNLDVYRPVSHFTIMNLVKQEGSLSFMLNFTVFDINLNVIDEFSVDL